MVMVLLILTNFHMLCRQADFQRQQCEKTFAVIRLISLRLLLFKRQTLPKFIQNVVNQCMTNGAPSNGVPESEDCLTVQITANQAALTGLALNAFYD